MLTLPLPDPGHQAAVLPAGTVLLRRARHDDHIHHLAEGRVALGLLGPEGLAHTLCATWRAPTGSRPSWP